MSNRSRDITNPVDINELSIFSFTFPTKPPKPDSVINSISQKLEAMGFGDRFLVLQRDGSWELVFLAGGILAGGFLTRVGQELGTDVYKALMGKILGPGAASEDPSQDLKEIGTELMVPDGGARKTPSIAGIRIEEIRSLLDAYPDVRLTYRKVDINGRYLEFIAEKIDGKFDMNFYEIENIRTSREFTI